MPLYANLKSENYGDIKYECIGILDYWKIIKHLTDDFNFWIDKYHPQNFFSAVLIIQLSEIDNEDSYIKELGRYAVFVPTEECNKDWDSSYWLKKYKMKDKGQSLPIAQSASEISKWQNSVSDKLLIPEYLKSAKNINDLQLDLPATQVKVNVKDIDFDS